MEDIKIKWKNKVVELKNKRAAWVEKGTMKYEGEGLLVKDSVEAYMQDWKGKRNYAQ